MVKNYHERQESSLISLGHYYFVAAHCILANAIKIIELFLSNISLIFLPCHVATSAKEIAC